jgi:CheY-like chemotaxis protein
MDVRLHGLDGFDVFERVRARSSPEHVKCAFLTGMNNKATERRASALGADAFFLKPSNSVELIEIARALQKLATQ